MCGKRAASLEDIIPKWLRNLFTTEGLQVMGRMTGGKYKPVGGGKFSLKGYVLCHQCNVNWLGTKIESRASREFKPYIQGAGGTLTPSLQSLISFWVAKTSYLMAFKAQLNPPADIGPHLRLTEQPTPETSVWIAGLADDFFMTWLHGLIPPPQHPTAGRREGLFTILVLGHVVLACLVNPDPGKRLHINFDPPWDRIVTQIWPPAVADREWPLPANLQNDRDVFAFVDHLIRGIPPGWRIVLPSQARKP